MHNLNPNRWHTRLFHTASHFMTKNIAFKWIVKGKQNRSYVTTTDFTKILDIRVRSVSVWTILLALSIHPILTWKVHKDNHFNQSNHIWKISQCAWRKVFFCDCQWVINSKVRFDFAENMLRKQINVAEGQKYWGLKTQFLNSRIWMDTIIYQHSTQSRKWKCSRQ